MSSTLDTTFDNFKAWLMSLFAMQYSPKNSAFTTPYAFDELGDKMLTVYNYTAEREQFLIQKAHFYIKIVLNQDLSHNTSVAFLEKLTNKMAAYLSYYVMQKYPIPENGKSKNKLRIKVQAELKKALFDDNPYIKTLIKRQAEKRVIRSKPRAERKAFIKEQRRENAQSAYRQVCQIRGEITDLFYEAQRTPRK